jgi:hypothetical protein
MTLTGPADASATASVIGTVPAVGIAPEINGVRLIANKPPFVAGLNQQSIGAPNVPELLFETKTLALSM